MEHTKGPKCSTRVIQPGDAFGSHLCNLKVTMEHDGKPYCTRHGRKVTTKAEAHAELMRHNDERNAEIAAYQKRIAEEQRKLDAFPDMLEALGSAKVTLENRSSATRYGARADDAAHWESIALTALEDIDAAIEAARG